MSDFYERVYSQDNPEGEAHGWIQWKGTDVCIDLHCKCGHHGHFDGDFLYFFRCPNCGQVYALGQVVKMIPLTGEDLAYVEREHSIQTCELECDDAASTPHPEEKK